VKVNPVDFQCVRDEGKNETGNFFFFHWDLLSTNQKQKKSFSKRIWVK
jgi:hypothetical protein